MPGTSGCSTSTTAIRARLRTIRNRGHAFDLSQPTISHHMKVLHEAGLVDRDKRGVWVYYRVRPQALGSLGALIGCPPQ